MSRPRHTGSLRLRRNVWWARFYHRGKRVEVSTQETDRGKAMTFLKTKLKDTDTPRFVPLSAERITFENLCDILRRDRSDKRRRSRIEHHLARLAEAFAGMPALHITTDAVDDYRQNRERMDAAPATINRELAALRRMFRLAVKKGKLPSMPDISLLAEDNVRDGFVDPPDFTAFLTALRTQDADAADAAEFAYRTALRRGNVLGAVWTWFALDVEHGRVTGGVMRLPGTATKNKRALTLPLAGELLALVDRRWQLRAPTCPYVFHRSGIQLQRFDHAWKTAATAIGRPGLLFHDLRRSAARTLRRAGVDVETIMKLGGWKTRAMFTRYTIVDERDLAEAQAKLDRVFQTATSRKVTPLRRRGNR